MSNLELIPLAVDLDARGLEVPPLELSTPGAEDLATLEIDVTEVQNGQRIAAKLNQAGTSRKGDHRGLKIYLDVPLPDDEWRERVDDAFRRLRVLAEKEGRLAEVDRYEAQKEALYVAWRETMREHRTGIFEVQCIYRSSEKREPPEGERWPGSPEYWVGEVRAEPIRIEIVYEGQAFDYLYESEEP